MRTLLLVTGMGLLTLAMAQSGGCKKTPAEHAAGAASITDNSNVEVRIGYFANLTHAQAVLGMASGDFAKAVAPAKVSTKVFNAGPSLTEALFAGEIDLGYVGPGPAIAAFTRSKGAGLRIIGGAAANGVVIVARKDSGISTLTDLVGRKLATPQLANTQDIAARHYLQSELKQTDLSNVMPVANAEQAALMDRGQIDAAWVPEPWGAVLIDRTGAKLIAQEKDLWPGQQVATTVIVASPRFLKEHPDLAKKLLEAHQQWTARLQAGDPAVVAQLKDALFTLTKKQFPPGVIDAALKRVTFTNDPLPETLATMAQWTYETGFAKEKPDLKGLVDSDFAGTMATMPGK